MTRFRFNLPALLAAIALFTISAFLVWAALTGSNRIEVLPALPCFAMAMGIFNGRPLRNAYIAMVSAIATILCFC
jgi:hypothetical protein